MAFSCVMFVSPFYLKATSTAAWNLQDTTVHHKKQQAKHRVSDGAREYVMIMLGQWGAHLTFP